MLSDKRAKSVDLEEARNWPCYGDDDPEDCIFHRNPSSIEAPDIAENESLRQSGERHYSEMLSVETVPDERYLKLYETALAANAARLRHDVEQLARAIQSRPQKIGRASCRERVCQYVSIPVVAVSLKKNNVDIYDCQCSLRRTLHHNRFIRIYK